MTAPNSPPGGFDPPQPPATAEPGADAVRALGTTIGPYRVDRFVARGGMANVFAATDTRTNEQCAVKLLHPIGHQTEARGRFRREFRALSRMNHPNVLKVYEFGIEGDRPWYSMELVQGRVLRAEAEAWRTIKPEHRFARAQGVLVQVARALAYIHGRGLVHRDITPANIMLRSDGVVKLMDFGVVKELGTELTVAGEMVGTVAYISPEQIAGGAIDARADLYSLGAVLYLMLTGRRPFTARTLQGYLEKHLHSTPKPPREVEPLVPEHLDRVCVRLLSKDPAERYASANHLLHVLGDHPEASSGGHFPPHVVGRAEQCASIQSLLVAATDSQPGGAIVLRGSPGSGRTRLLDLAQARAELLGLRVARAACRPHDRPFGPFVSIYEQLDAPVRPPILQDAFYGEGQGGTRERYPIVAAFRELLSASGPTVLLLDDIDRADPATGDLLEYLVRNTLELASEPIVFVVTESNTRRSVSQRLGKSATRYDLAPLDLAQVEELVLSVLPIVDTSYHLAKRIHDESDGLPAFVSDMLRGLRDDGRLIRESGHWALTLDASEITRSSLPMPASLRQALAQRLEPLGQNAIEVARAVAVARRHLDLDALVEVCPLDEDDVIDAIDELVDADIISERHGDDLDRVELSQQRFRDILLEPLSPDELRARHRNMGEVLERLYRHRTGVVVEQLTHHFERADVPTKAYAYLLQTARKHLANSLYEEAQGFLERAIHAAPAAKHLLVLDQADRQLCEVFLARSQCRYHLGQWPRALDDAREALALADDVRDPRLLSRVSAELGNQMRVMGQLVEAERHLRAAISYADTCGDTSLRPMPLYQLGGLLWSTGELEQAEALWVDALATAQRVGDERAMGYGYNGLGILAICKGHSMEARKHLEGSARLFERLGMLAPLAIARVNLSEVYHDTGILKKALALAERTISQAREVNHPHGIALGMAHRATILSELSRHEEAKQNAYEALRLVRSLGTSEDEVLALATLVRVRMGSGKWQRALSHLDELLPLLQEMDPEGIGPEVSAWHAHVLCELGRVDEANEVMSKTAIAEGAWPHIRVRTALAIARAQARLGHVDEARGQLKDALQLAEANGYRFYQLQTHHELSKVVDDDIMRARHARIAKALARSLAANLSAEDSRGFLSRGWGDIET